MGLNFGHVAHSFVGFSRSDSFSVTPFVSVAWAQDCPGYTLLFFFRVPRAAPPRFVAHMNSEFVPGGFRSSSDTLRGCLPVRQGYAFVWRAPKSMGFISDYTVVFPSHRPPHLLLVTHNYNK